MVLLIPDPTFAGFVIAPMPVIYLRNPREGARMKPDFLQILHAVTLALAVGGASGAHARQSDVGETVLVDAGMEITVETAEGIRAYISHPLIPVTFSGLWYIAPGSYSIRREARIDGRR